MINLLFILVVCFLSILWRIFFDLIELINLFKLLLYIKKWLCGCLIILVVIFWVLVFILKNIIWLCGVIIFDKNWVFKLNILFINLYFCCCRLLYLVLVFIIVMMFFVVIIFFCLVGILKVCKIKFVVLLKNIINGVNVKVI